jgi:hypothetical protein
VIRALTILFLTVLIATPGCQLYESVEDSQARLLHERYQSLELDVAQDEVRRLLGAPDFVQRPISDAFRPQRCDTPAEAVWIYQRPGLAQTLLVFFVEDKVVCKELSDTIQLSHS